MTDVDDKINLKEKSPSEWSRIQLRKEMIRSLTQMLTKESEEDTASQNIICALISDSRKQSSLYKRPPQTEKGCTVRTWEYDQAFELPMNQLIWRSKGSLCWWKLLSKDALQIVMSYILEQNGKALYCKETKLPFSLP